MLTADAWRGSRIRDAITAFLEQASGAPADIVAYVGHDGLMAPEAYTLTVAIEAWVKTGDAASVREAAAQAYHKYQKCGIKAARRLFR